jgi:adenylate kinase
MYVVILGAPGAGKGTQADILSQKIRVPHIASGDLFRRALEERTELGLLAKGYMEKGELVPDEVVTKMILERLSQPDCASGCVFDGFPRTLPQARALDEALVSQAKNIDRAIYIEVPNEELVRRLSGRWLCRKCQTPYHVTESPPEVPGRCDKCGGELYQRPDDNNETVKERIKVFLAQTIPILDYYEEQAKLTRVNGNLGVEVVAKEMMSALGTPMSR